MRTPEEAARLASGVTVETPSGVGTITTKVIEWGERRILSHAVMPGIDKEEALVCLAADLAEARAALEVETGWRCELGAAYHEEARRHADTKSELAEALAEVAASKADAAGWEHQMDMAVQRADQLSAEVGMLEAEVAALREGVELVREWQAAKHANHQAYDAWREVAVKNPGVRMPEVEKVYSTANECRAIESRLLAATLPEVSRG